MLERTLRVLEFNKIKDMMKPLALSDAGRELIEKLEPTSDLATAQLWQQETEEASVILTYIGSNPLTSFEDVRPYLRLAQIGSSLSMKALLAVAAFMRAGRSARAALVTDRDNTPYINSLASGLMSFRQLEEDIDAAIISEDEMSDHASPELYELRRKIRTANDKIRERLNSYIHNPNTQKYLQDFIITVRNGRYVLPVKAECRGAVPGLIHDQSATGATLFIEPMAIVEINNDLKELMGKEKQEIERILASFTQQIAPECDSLRSNLEILAQLDFAFAKAQLSRSMRAVQPKLNNNGYLRIIRGRHPLLDPEKVVPSDIWLGAEFTTLVITGPNTGGKTVTLKTVGLFTLMAQAGLQVPADLGTELAVFDSVFADIGDEQSIEQSLSTFSSHMTNIVSILQDMTPDSLVMFDELGAGTDPTEGAALAMAILDTLLKDKVRTMATTHYSELKEYALSHPGVENASVEFNVQTLRPTYRLSIGIPGKSNAFEISRKLGLPEEIIEEASKRLSHDQVRFEDVISNAESQRQIAERERELAQQARIEMQRLRDETDRQRKELEKQRESMMRKARDDARRVLQSAQRESEQIISELKKQRAAGASGLKEHELAAMRSKLQSGLDEVSAINTSASQDESQPLKSVKVGDYVEITHLNTTGTVASLPDARGEVQVQAGALKLKVPLKSLRSAKPPKKEKNKWTPALGKDSSKSAASVSVRDRSVATETDVRGMTLEEAILAVDLYLDNAAMQQLGEVYIIHGKGTGVLRAGIQDHLRHHPHVKSFRLGKYGEGEDGVTVVTLK